MVIDDNEFATARLSPQDSFAALAEASSKQTEGQDGADIEDFDLDAFLANFEGDNQDLFGDLLHSPSGVKTEFNFDLNSTEPTGDGQAPSAEPTVKAEEALTGTAPTDNSGKGGAAPLPSAVPPGAGDASSLLTFPTDPASPSLLTIKPDPASVDDIANDPLPMANSGIPPLNPPPALVGNSEQRHPAPDPTNGVVVKSEQTLLDPRQSLSVSSLSALGLPDSKALAANSSYGSQLPNIPGVPGSGPMNLFMPGQPLNAQVQPAVPPPPMVSTTQAYPPIPYPVNTGGVQYYPGYWQGPSRPGFVPPAHNPPFQLTHPVPRQPYATTYSAPYPRPSPAQGMVQTPVRASTPHGVRSQTGTKRHAEDDEDDDDYQPPAKKISYKRANLRRESNAASNWYKLPRKPTDWGTNIDKARPNEAIFKYNNEGEWLPNKFYTTDELHAFFVGPNNDGRAPSRRCKLTMWIQNTPPYANHRYPHGRDSTLCRWVGCPIPNNSITKMQLRVAMDERADRSGRETDPFHCTGYMHLYCFEQAFELFDFVLDHRFNIWPDTRVLPHEERNPMMPMQSRARLDAVFTAWCEERRAVSLRCRRAGVEYPGTPRTKRLYHVLTEARLAADPGHTEALARKIDVHVGKYMGDLQLYQELLAARKQKRRASQATYRESSVIDDDDDSRDLDDGRGSRPPTSHRPGFVVPDPARGQAAGQYYQYYSPQPPGPYWQGPPPPPPPPTTTTTWYGPPPPPPPQGHSHRGPPNPATTTVAGQQSGAAAAPPPPPPAAPPAAPEPVEAAVRECFARAGARLCDAREVERARRVVAAVIPALVGMPHHARVEAGAAVRRRAERLRAGAVPRRGSGPAVLMAGRGLR